MLHLHDIESGYGAGQVLFGVSLSVPAGRVVSLMGRNGMGKTTTIRTIMGQLPLTAGRISRFGNDQPDQSPFQIARARHRACSRRTADFFQSRCHRKFENILPAAA